MADTSPPPARNAPPNMLARTALLALSLLLLFPQLLARIADGAWPRFVLGLGVWRWIAWAGCFVVMTLLRFAHLPKRGE